MRYSTIVSYWLLMALTIAVLDGAVAKQSRNSESDSKIRAEVAKKLSHDKKLSGVKAIVEDGTVTLYGTVPSLSDRQDAEKKARVHGVAGVKNLINVMSSSGVGADDTILREAIKRVRTDPFYSIYDDVNLSVHNGVVTLAGEVWQPQRKSDYEKRISSIPGVKQVRNQLKVSPTSPTDDELRYLLTRAIYSHPGLEKYALSPDPPIHIIVDHQRVRITGIVNSELDKALVTSIVNGFTTFQVTNDLRVETKERKKR